MPPVAPQRIVVEARFKHNLGFYSQMDLIGMRIQEMGFSDWKRTSNSLEVQNRQKGKKISLAISQAILDDALPGDEMDNDSLQDALAEAIDSMGKERLVRIGVRQWFALKLQGHDKQAHFKAVSSTFSNLDTVEAITKGKVSDTAYTFEFEESSSSGGQVSGRLSTGGMQKEEWLNLVNYGGADNPKVSYIGEDGMAKIHENLPDSFVYVDIDYGQEYSSELIASTEPNIVIKDLTEKGLNCAKSLLRKLNEK